MSILLATSSTPLADAMQRTLEYAGHTVFVAMERAGLADVSRDDGVSIIVLDDMCDDALRDAVLRVRHEICDSAKTLLLATYAADGAATAGAPDDGDVVACDAVLTKPFSDAQLLSYIALLADDSYDPQDPALLIHGDLTLDTKKCKAFYRGSRQPLPLSPREYGTLEALIRAHGEFLSFDDLVRAVCGEGFFEQRDIMRGVLYSLTRKLHNLGFFITQRGSRYRIR